jgi:hypothetical protein
MGGVPVPNPSGSCLLCIVAEVARLPPERTLHAVRQVNVTAVKDLAEHIREQGSNLARSALPGELRSEGIQRHRYVADLTTGSFCDLLHGLGEREQPRTGELVDLADVLVVG